MLKDEQSHWQFPESRVLIVDDGAENRELLRLLLQEAGLTVDEAENGQIGVEKALAGQYDVILMDVNMPVMDGFTATQKLRQQGLKTSIIALTANAMKGFEQECLDVGYSGYCSKPIDIDRFMAQMADLLGGQKTANEAGAAHTSTEHFSTDIDANALQSASGPPIYSKMPDCNGKFRGLIVRFIAHLKKQLPEVERAREQGKLEEVAVFAHQLKGVGGSVGFDEFTAPAGKLEKLAKEGGSEAEIRQTIAELRGLAARLVTPGTEPTEMAKTAGEPSQETSPPRELKTIQPHSATKKPVVSRLGAIPRFQKVILRFIDKLKEELSRAQLAWENENLEELALIAHWLKGAGGTVGFDDFTEPAAKLETFAKSAQLEQAGQMLEQVKHLSKAIVSPVEAHV